MLFEHIFNAFNVWVAVAEVLVRKYNASFVNVAGLFCVLKPASKNLEYTMIQSYFGDLHLIFFSVMTSFINNFMVDSTFG